MFQHCPVINDICHCCSIIDGVYYCGFSQHVKDKPNPNSTVIDFNECPLNDVRGKSLKRKRNTASNKSKQGFSVHRKITGQFQ